MRSLRYLSLAASLAACNISSSGNLLVDNQIEPPADTSGLGQVSAFYCDYGDSSYPITGIPMWSGYDTGGLVTYEEALEECDLAAWVSDGSIYCEWNGQPIFLSEREAGDCDDARFGGEPGDGICSQAPELNIISSYEARGDHSGNDNHPTGNTSVHIERSGPQVLVLSSYEPVEWTVTTAPGAQLTQVIATGYYTPTVNVPAGVPVEILSYDLGNFDNYVCAYEFPDNSPTSGCETPLYFEEIEALTGLEVTSFNGCYQLTDATLHGDLRATTNCNNPNDPANQSGYGSTGYIDPDCGVASEPDPDGDGGCGESFCGDGVVDFELAEECDDGNNVDGDGCDAFCFVEAGCGDIDTGKQ